MGKVRLFVLISVLLPDITYSDEMIEASNVLSVRNEIVVCQSSAIQPPQIPRAPLGPQIQEFFALLFDTNSWPPRWYCGTWTKFHGWFYIGSDFFIWLSYFAIPAILFYFLYKRKENVPFKGVFLFFGFFILLCGLTHLIDMVTFWWPAYRLSALIRFGTAFISVGTVFMLVKIVPRALELKSPEILENMVNERTKELVSLNVKYEQEIAERKNVESEVIRLNKELNDFRKAITDSSIISVTDRKGTISYVNDNFIQISGYSENELVGANHRIINSGHHGKEFWVRMWQTISRGETWREEVKNRTKDGSFYWVDTFIMPFKDHNDKINQFLSIRNDITDKKEAEEELRSLNTALELRVEEKTRDIRKVNDRLIRINELFKSVQSHANIGVWEYEVAKGELYLSPEAYRVLHYPENGKPVSAELLRFVGRDDKRMICKAIRLCLEKGVKYDFELLANVYDGQRLWLRTTGIPDYRNGKIVRIKGIIQNIDSLKKKESELQQSKAYLTELNEELESFTYSVSHDLRAPLRYIHGYVKILEEDYADKLDGEGNEVLQVIVKNTQKMGQLIDDLLDFSRLGRKEMVLDNCDMERIVQDVIDEYVNYYDTARVELKIGKILPARADYNMIKQVWINLISNAFKYSEKKDSIYIEVGSKEQKDIIQYHVKDRGAGFDPAYMHKLFNVFQRLHKAEEFSGTGVGLAIVQRIVTRHKGEVWAEAEENVGADFYFTLPK